MLPCQRCGRSLEDCVRAKCAPVKTENREGPIGHQWIACIDSALHRVTIHCDSCLSRAVIDYNEDASYGSVRGLFEGAGADLGKECLKSGLKQKFDAIYTDGHTVSIRTYEPAPGGEPRRVVALCNKCGHSAIEEYQGDFTSKAWQRAVAVVAMACDSKCMLREAGSVTIDNGLYREKCGCVFNRKHELQQPCEYHTAGKQATPVPGAFSVEQFRPYEPGEDPSRN